MSRGAWRQAGAAERIATCRCEVDQSWLWLWPRVERARTLRAGRTMFAGVGCRSHRSATCKRMRRRIHVCMYATGEPW